MNYQIVEHSPTFAFAGSKAPSDVEQILDGEAFKPIEICMVNDKPGIMGKISRQIRYFRDWDQAYHEIQDNSLLFLQYPFHYPQLTREKTLKKLKNRKHVRIAGIVHDIEKLRGYRYNRYYRDEFNFMLGTADVLIVHNDAMKEYLISRGYDQNQIVTLGVFDYLVGDETRTAALAARRPAFERSLTIAGNLDPHKSGYIAELSDIQRIHIHLYGTHFDSSMKQYPNISYHGVFKPDELPEKIRSGFGLVWDGNTIHTCAGDAGNYLRYNNPHKLSLYLAAGIPVIIWKEAAEAEFVTENHLGVTVDSVDDAEKILQDFSEDRYNELTDAVKKIQKQIITGEFTRMALHRAMEKV